MKFFIRLLTSSLILMLSPYFISGIEVKNFYIAIITVIFIGLVNALIRPILIILTLPINIITLGLFTLVINGLMIMFVASFIKGFEVAGIWPAILLSLLMWLSSWLINSITKENYSQPN